MSRIPIGANPIEGAATGFVVWSLDWESAQSAVGEDPEAFAEAFGDLGCEGIAFDLSALRVPTADRTTAVTRFVDALQVRGISVVLHDVSAAFLTAVQMDGTHPRCATCDGLSTSVDTLRDHDEMRKRCTSIRGRRIHQLRMPARALSLAPLCVFLGDRLARLGLAVRDREDLVTEAYAALSGILEGAYGALESLSASVGVHEGRATITLLDSGPARENEVILPGEGARVDRIHRFRILDQHNALVLEKDVALAGTVAGEVSF